MNFPFHRHEEDGCGAATVNPIFAFVGGTTLTHLVPPSVVEYTDEV
jgi:hypothetical protein